jgi:hypothetical protein
MTHELPQLWLVEPRYCEVLRKLWHGFRVLPCPAAPSGLPAFRIPVAGCQAAREHIREKSRHRVFDRAGNFSALWSLLHQGLLENGPQASIYSPALLVT